MNCYQRHESNVLSGMMSANHQRFMRSSSNQRFSKKLAAPGNSVTSLGSSMTSGASRDFGSSLGAAGNSVNLPPIRKSLLRSSMQGGGDREKHSVDFLGLVKHFTERKTPKSPRSDDRKSENQDMNQRYQQRQRHHHQNAAFDSSFSSVPESRRKSKDTTPLQQRGRVTSPTSNEAGGGVKVVMARPDDNPFSCSWPHAFNSGAGDRNRPKQQQVTGAMRTWSRLFHMKNGAGSSRDSTSDSSAATGGHRRKDNGETLDRHGVKQDEKPDPRVDQSGNHQPHTRLEPRMKRSTEDGSEASSSVVEPPPNTFSSHFAIAASETRAAAKNMNTLPAAAVWDDVFRGVEREDQPHDPDVDQADEEEEMFDELDIKCIKWLEDVALERSRNPDKIFLPHLLMP